MKMKTFLLTLTLGGLTLVTAPLFGQETEVRTAAEQAYDSAEQARNEQNLILEQKANDAKRMEEVKEARKETRAIAKETRRVNREATNSDRAAKSAVRAEKKAQKARKDADNQAKDAEKAKVKSDKNN